MIRRTGRYLVLTVDRIWACLPAGVQQCCRDGQDGSHPLGASSARSEPDSLKHSERTLRSSAIPSPAQAATRWCAACRSPFAGMSLHRRLYLQHLTMIQIQTKYLWAHCLQSSATIERLQCIHKCLRIWVQVCTSYHGHCSREGIHGPASFICGWTCSSLRNLSRPKDLKFALKSCQRKLRLDSVSRIEDTSRQLL